MKFKENQSIYLQIADRLCDEILIEKYQEEERIPSVREYAALVEVNVNTIVRTYEYLQGLEIIYTKRGLGYFVTPGAKDCILQLRRRHFLQEELPEFFKQLQLLDISIDEIKELVEEAVQLVADIRNK